MATGTIISLGLYFVVMLGIGLFAFGLASSFGNWGITPFIILFGVGWGGGAVMRTTMGRQYFGRKNFGTIFGFMTGINSIGVIAGPPLAGWVFDSQGSYVWAWYGLAASAILASLILLTIPTKKPETF